MGSRVIVVDDDRCAGSAQVVRGGLEATMCDDRWGGITVSARGFWLAMKVRMAAVLCLALAACSTAAARGREAARREAEAEARRQAKELKPTDHIKPPVAQGVRLPCTQLIDPEAFTTALEETETLTVRDATGAMSNATASCSLIRGGARPDAKEQEKLIKKYGRLGSLPGDEICNVTLYCWVVEEESKFRDRCQAGPNLPLSQDTSSTGGFACKKTMPVGQFDVDSFKFIDEDTKCLFEVRGGPSMTDNDYIAACARVARESIGADHIKQGAPSRIHSDSDDGGDDTDQPATD